MRAMMLDVMQNRFQRLDAEGLPQLFLEADDLRAIGETLTNGADRRALGQDEFRALEEPRVRIAVDGDVVDVVQIDARFIEAVADGDRWEAGPVFDAAEAFFLGCRDEFPVHDDGRRGVGVMGVDSEDDHWGV